MKINIYILFFTLIMCFNVFCNAQSKDTAPVYKPFVNQAGYNLGESKRFVCYGAPDNTPFKIVNTKTSQSVFEGRMRNKEGWVEISEGKDRVIKLEVTETGTNMGVFTARYQVPKARKGSNIEISYGYWAFKTNSVLIVNN
jgi:hypothetical protein